VAGLRDGAESSGSSARNDKYPGTRHGFHNNSTPRFDESAAKLAWDRTIAHFKKYLA
jgi:carboxymethylenebutenolidase